jgi:hypothetical protein
MSRTGAGLAIEFRKHLGWYVKGLPDSADLRRRLHAVDSLSEVEGIFEDYLRTPRASIEASQLNSGKHFNGVTGARGDLAPGSFSG